ncbi:response regulator transcription factor [Bacillus sp. DTU_2020_1000418_1_SI_GHA_SEK_038]|uniref:response regulator transcription factor n=1 Tax=Bacillus sp. DTU_2020_1000418_1_SI_GHA_SEK_038 TaxID=3077585 RepID=UPI0028E6A61F|nr:response regulator transcription factor [Bacillus sp. DTU_2020_1000418_1_SI_GHA_SEK_038]WNS75741.1 response regulator transcription factor [Bacillus sp. DTU_2020_1000418_1_SI_GHA_SEK_038]
MSVIKKLRIVIADDQTLFREGLQTILNLEDDMEVVGVADNGQKALEIVLKHDPDVVLMDVEMPVMNGIESTRHMKEQFPNTKVLILSTFAEDNYIVEGLAHGACGYLLKDLHADTLISSIRSAATGQFILPAPIAAKLASRLLKASEITDTPFAHHRKPEHLIEELTEREKKMANLIVKGFTNKEIAARLFMSEGTVRNYISVIYSKLGTNNRSKAILLLNDLLGEDKANT